MRQHALTLGIVAFAFMIIYTAGCESKKDPFSAKNQAPQITAFFFRPDENPKVGEDSLKFKSNKSYRIHLEFKDVEFTNSETQTLEAVFNFINGSGTFSHNDLQPIGESALRFITPPTFNDDILFVPDTSGLIRIELTLTDGVKTTDPPARTAPTVFFLNLSPVPSFTTSQDQDNPFRFRFDPAASYDRDGAIEKFIWIFGDATTPDTLLDDKAVTHEYASAGKYSVVLKVMDNDGAISASNPVEVTTPPVAVLQVTPTQGTFPLVVVIDATGSQDPSGGELTYEIFIDNQLTYTAQNLVTHVFNTPRVSAYIIRLHVVSSRTGLDDDAIEAVVVK
ncbi:MAG: PKD domain-containing protein, partial [bacterium]